jgi:hypothetical protein
MVYGGWERVVIDKGLWRMDFDIRDSIPMYFRLTTINNPFLGHKQENQIIQVTSSVYT